ncbi:hypothetical protein FACS1894172_18260 [Spirochaetia bacterium]|nr:hypothetical protein FACS1894164_17000 [Spirochaetia bacterium]GHU35904.1 hypothetical protein FACS1894172_18260 [Spirochaetia bacterium]
MKKIIVYALLIAGILFPVESQEGMNRDDLLASEEFRIGVQAFNRFAYNEAILSFERALAFAPNEALYHDWLGRAYYRSGLEGTALSQWQAASTGYDPQSLEYLLTRSRIETVQNRRGIIPLIGEVGRYVEVGHFPGSFEEISYFKQPTGLLPLEDGSTWIVAYGSNEIVRVNVNGIILDRKRGPINGFDRPYDIVRGIDGRLFLSEYRGGRVSVLTSAGDWQSYIGSKGIGEGQFVGPQNLAVDEEGYVYVVDYGNRRVSKFDPDGTFILSFGTKNPDFSGFVSPTGIAARNGRIYVADSAAKRIVIFDRNGSYRGILVSTGLNGPESLRFLPDERLLIADSNRLLAVDLNTAIVTELGLTGSSRVRITNAASAVNGTILTANFAGNEVSVMTGIDNMASGLFVQIDRIVSDAFPTITVDISVQDRLRRPIVGLNDSNFVLTEKGGVVADQKFLGSGSLSTESDIAIVLERSEKTALLAEEVASALRDIDTNNNGRIVSVISAGIQPVKERIDGAASGDMVGTLSQPGIRALSQGNPAVFSPRWRLDLGIRLAATELLSGSRKRAVVLVSSGAIGELSFDQYNLSELTAYLLNNDIALYTIVVGGRPAGNEIQYLCTQTGGQFLSLYQNEGIGPALQSISRRASGSYQFSYQSQLQTDFGRAYLPVEVEVYLLERSGRDSTGYFPPLE